MITAIDVFNPENRIKDAVIMSIRYGDDTPIYQAVRQSEAAQVIKNAPAFRAVAEQVKATPENLKGKRVTIQCASSNGVAALGCARIEWSA